MARTHASSLTRLPRYKWWTHAGDLASQLLKVHAGREAGRTWKELCDTLNLVQPPSHVCQYYLRNFGKITRHEFCGPMEGVPRRRIRLPAELNAQIWEKLSAGEEPRKIARWMAREQEELKLEWCKLNLQDWTGRMAALRWGMTQAELELRRAEIKERRGGRGNAAKVVTHSAKPRPSKPPELRAVIEKDAEASDVDPLDWSQFNTSTWVPETEEEKERVRRWEETMRKIKEKRRKQKALEESC